jgi:hypothetical protein
MSPGLPFETLRADVKFCQRRNGVATRRSDLAQSLVFENRGRAWIHVVVPSNGTAADRISRLQILERYFRAASEFPPTAQRLGARPRSIS